MTLKTAEEIDTPNLNEILGERAEMAASPTPFPEKGLSEKAVIDQVSAKLERSVPPHKNWAVYGTAAHPFAKKVISIPEAIDSYAVEFYREIYPGVHEMSQESVRMIGSLLNATNPAGYITVGGSEANLLGVRLARNLGKKQKPEIVIPYSKHYTFDLAEELLGVKMRVVDVNEDYSPKMDQVEKLINENTVALACSAPEGNLGGIDPVVEFSEIAEKRGLYLHVDSAIGGFMLPFMKMLGYNVPQFDFGLPGVTSMTVDPHKTGMTARPSGSFIVRDQSYLDKAIPIERVIIDTIVASGRSGSSSAVVWAMIKHLGKDGYMKLIKAQIEITRMLARRVEEIDGLRLLVQPETNMVSFTSDEYDIEEISKRLWARGYAIPLSPLLPYKTMYLRLYVHPSKDKSAGEAILTDLEQIMKTVRAG